MEFVRIRYPRDRQVLVDNVTFRPTNRTFRVERGTHSFAIDEPADPPFAEDFIELTSQQEPREFFFTPLAAEGATRGTTRSKPARATPARKKAAATRAKAKPRKTAATSRKKGSTTRKAKPSPKRKRRS